MTISGGGARLNPSSTNPADVDARVRATPLASGLDWFAEVALLGQPGGGPPTASPRADAAATAAPPATSSPPAAASGRTPPPPIQVDGAAAAATARALEPTPAPPLARGEPPRPASFSVQTPTARPAAADAAALDAAQPRVSEARGSDAAAGDARASARSQNSRVLDAQATMTALPGSANRRPRPSWTRRPEPSPTGTPAPTRTPRPPTSPTPRATTIPYQPPTVKNGDNKWGVGVYKDSNRVIDSLRETQPGVILLMDPSEGWARRVRETVPNAFIVGRRYRAETDQPLDHPQERGEEMADWVAELAVPLRGVVDGWMSYNEVTGSQPSQDYADWNKLQVAFARRLQYVHGVAAVAGNDGSGALDPDDYVTYFADAVRASQFLGVHAYSPPATARMQQDAEWNALRYRKIHDALERAGIRGKQMVITESGLGDGFRPGVASDEQMASDFAWFTNEMRQDSYVIGQAAFGIFDGTGAWNRFDLTGTNVLKLLPQLTRR